MINEDLTATINIKNAKLVLGDDCSSIDDDLLLFDSFHEVPLATEMKRMNGVFVALCLDGGAQYSVDTQEHRVHGKDVIVVSNGQLIGNYMFSPDCRGMAIMVSNDFFAEIIKEVHEISQLFLFAYANPVFKINDEKVDTFIGYFNIIRNKVDDMSNHFRRELAMSLLKAMIYDIGNEIYQKQLKTAKRSRAEVIFNEFIQLVKENFHKERRVGWYGEKMCITPKYLSEAVKQVSRRTPTEWIDHYVTLEIRVMLKNSSMSIKEIAQTLNFPNQSFLGKFFKEHVGVSPSQYRRS